MDTSNSMDGLIDQAKSQLWKMVNKLATAKRKGQTPKIELALYEYGNDGLSNKEGYIRQVSALTSDLDFVSEQLFGLTTNGGNEYCGYVIKNAVEDLEWSASNKDLKLVIIAGNEPFNQGPEKFENSCGDAIKNGIMVNTIFCGAYEEGVRGLWQKGAELADGQYINIDHNEAVTHVSTPYDQEIIDLNRSLNGTYIGYGSQGAANVARQEAQDANAAEYGATNLSTRATFKAKKSYSNAEWDLVDAVEEDAEVMESLDEASLPPEMVEMDTEERKAFVEEKSKEREKIRKEILALEKKANEFREKELAKQAGEGAQTLDKVMLEMIEEQAKENAFEFDQQ
ncbi:MAG: VWA domain-containing protein [Bacteroidota bacterium]